MKKNLMSFIKVLISITPKVHEILLINEIFLIIIENLYDKTYFQDSIYILFKLKDVKNLKIDNYYQYLLVDKFNKMIENPNQCA